MKGRIAWLCYGSMWDDESTEDCAPELRFSEPDRWGYRKVVKVVIFEVEDE